MNLSPVVVPLSVSSNQNRISLCANPQQRNLPMRPSSGIYPTVNADYEDLENLPSINGVTLIGDKSSADLGIDQTFVYQQNVASDEWVIEHNLGRFPTVTVVDSAGTVVVGEVRYIDSNTIRVKFIGAFSGNAYLN